MPITPEERAELWKEFKRLQQEEADADKEMSEEEIKEARAFLRAAIKREKEAAAAAAAAKPATDTDKAAKDEAVRKSGLRRVI